MHIYSCACRYTVDIHCVCLYVYVCSIVCVFECVFECACVYVCVCVCMCVCVGVLLKNPTNVQTVTVAYSATSFRNRYSKRSAACDSAYRGNR